MAVQRRTRRILGALTASLVTAALATAPGATASAASCEVWSGVPPPNPGAAQNVFGGVAAPGPCNVWAVGFYRNVTDGQVLSLAEHWNGSAWKVEPTPSPDTGINSLRAVSAAAGGDVWAVGFTGGNTFILHWNGTAWT